jgi:hypothetical protein
VTGDTMLAMPRYLIGLSILSMPFTLTHSFEDFSVGIEQSRFGLPLLPAAFVTQRSWQLPRSQPEMSR